MSEFAIDKNSGDPVNVVEDGRCLESPNLTSVIVIVKFPGLSLNDSYGYLEFGEDGTRKFRFKIEELPASEKFTLDNYRMLTLEWETFKNLWLDKEA